MTAQKAGKAAVSESVITCIYVPEGDRKLELLVDDCLRATDGEFPGETAMYAAIDHATRMIWGLCHECCWTMLELPEGEPPRMKRLLRLALEQVDTEFVWTIEQDVKILPGRGRAVKAMMTEHPDFAGIGCFTVGSSGVKETYPSCYKKLIPYPDTEDLYRPILGRPERGKTVLSLSCACWRTAALKELNWSKIPEFPRTDQGMCKRLVKRGWLLGLMREQTAIHYCGRSRRHLRSNG